MALQDGSKSQPLSAGAHKIETVVLDKLVTGESRGDIWHDLVLIRDSGKKDIEFRVQLEVSLKTKDEADKVEAAIAVADKTGNRKALEAALNVVLKAINSQASETFRKGVELAFQDQPGWQQ